MIMVPLRMKHPNPRYYSTRETYLAACQQLEEKLAEEEARRSRLSFLDRLREDLRSIGRLRTITIDAPPERKAAPPPRYAPSDRPGMEAKWR